MRTGRTTENGDLNVLAAVRQVHQKTDPSSPASQRTTGVRTRSPSPAHRPSQVNGGAARPAVSSTAAKHCHECGEAFPVDWAKFCCECGEKRFGLE